VAGRGPGKEGTALGQQGEPAPLMTGLNEGILSSKKKVEPKGCRRLQGRRAQKPAGRKKGAFEEIRQIFVPLGHLFGGSTTSQAFKQERTGEYQPERSAELRQGKGRRHGTKKKKGRICKDRTLLFHEVCPNEQTTSDYAEGAPKSRNDESAYPAPKTASGEA